MLKLYYFWFTLIGISSAVKVTQIKVVLSGAEHHFELNQFTFMRIQNRNAYAIKGDCFPQYAKTDVKSVQYEAKGVAGDIPVVNGNLDSSNWEHVLLFINPPDLKEHAAEVNVTTKYRDIAMTPLPLYIGTDETGNKYVKVPAIAMKESYDSGKRTFEVHPAGKIWNNKEVPAVPYVLFYAHDHDAFKSTTKVTFFKTPSIDPEIFSYFSTPDGKEIGFSIPKVLVEEKIRDSGCLDFTNKIISSPENQYFEVTIRNGVEFGRLEKRFDDVYFLKCIEDNDSNSDGKITLLLEAQEVPAIKVLDNIKGISAKVLKDDIDSKGVDLTKVCGEVRTTSGSVYILIPHLPSLFFYTLLPTE